MEIMTIEQLREHLERKGRNPHRLARTPVQECDNETFTAIRWFDEGKINEYEMVNMIRTAKKRLLLVDPEQDVDDESLQPKRRQPKAP